MLQRQSVVPLDATRVRVQFIADGRVKEVVVEDPDLATQLLVNKRDIAGVNAQCQGQCEAAETEFNALAKDAEAAYQAQATALRNSANAKIKTAQDDQRAMIGELVAVKEKIETTAFEKAELLVVQEGA